MVNANIKPLRVAPAGKATGVEEYTIDYQLSLHPQAEMAKKLEKQKDSASESLANYKATHPNPTPKQQGSSMMLVVDDDVPLEVSTHTVRHLSAQRMILNAFP